MFVHWTALVAIFGAGMFGDFSKVRKEKIGFQEKKNFSDEPPSNNILFGATST